MLSASIGTGNGEGCSPSQPIRGSRRKLHIQRRKQIVADYVLVPKYRFVSNLKHGTRIGKSSFPVQFLVSHLVYALALAMQCLTIIFKKHAAVKNALHFRERGPIYSQPHAICTENLVKHGHAVFEILKLKDRQTDR